MSFMLHYVGWGPTVSLGCRSVWHYLSGASTLWLRKRASRVHKYWLNGPRTLEKHIWIYFPPRFSFGAQKHFLKILTSICPPPPPLLPQLLSANLSTTLHFPAQRVSTSCFTAYTLKHTKDGHTEKIKKQRVSKRQCISPQSTEPRHWKTKKQRQKTSLFSSPPPTLPTFILFAFQRLHLFVCFIAFFFPRRFPFSSFFLGHIQCNDDNYKIKQNDKKKKS